MLRIVRATHIVNATYHATGMHVRDLPIRPDKLLAWPSSFWCSQRAAKITVGTGRRRAGAAVVGVIGGGCGRRERARF